jgi:hypothetical protein
MTDIITRLREFGATSNPGGIYEGLPFEAANEIERLHKVMLTGLTIKAEDEIERLRAAVKTIEHSSRCNGGGFISKNSLLDVVRRHGDIARSALVSKP